MPTYSDTKVDLVINKPTQSQFDGAAGLDPTELYLVDPEFAGGKALATDNNGDIVETSVTSTELGYLSGTTSSVQTQLNGKASTSLDNLSANGQMIIDSQNGTVSNCVLDIPQDINITLYNGTLTLKSGSKYYMANGTQYQTSADLTITQSSNGTFMVIIPTAGTSISTVSLSNCVSGATDSLSGTAYHAWLDTTNNVVNYYSSDGTTPMVMALPLAKITVSGGAISSIDQVFNGIGFIGHHTFVTPDVKALIPDGYNSDGTLKSMLASTNALSIIDMGTNNKSRYVILGIADGTISPNNATIQYVSREDNASDPYGFTFKDNKYIGIGSSVLNIQLYFVKLAIIEREQTSPYSAKNIVIRQSVQTATVEMLNNYLSTLTGYNASATQTLKNVNGVLTWVTDS